MPDTQPNPCQFPAAWGPHAAAFSVTFQGPPLTGRNAGPGLTWSEGLCRAHVQPRTDQVRTEGGQVVHAKELEPPPAPPTLEPVGLDAVDPPARPFRPDWAVHPGEILGELISEQHLTQKVVATSLGWPVEWVGQVVDGKHDVTPEMAADLARVFGLTAGAWMRLQERYVTWRGEQQARAETGV